VVALRSTLANNFHLIWSVYRESRKPCVQGRLALCSAHGTKIPHCIE
jgi:hypothetical protein